MSGPLFRDRSSAGQQLAEAVARRWAEGQMKVENDLPPMVLALPRGGVPVAVPVARRLGAELDVLVAVKVPAPGPREVGVGAVVEDGPPVFDLALLRRFGVTPGDLAPSVGSVEEEVRRRVRAYRAARPVPDLTGRTVVLVDDGVATGATTRAALRWLRRRRPPPHCVVLATPLLAPYALEQACDDADLVVRLRSPDPFVAVSRYYRSFPQLADDEVRRLLS